MIEETTSLGKTDQKETTKPVIRVQSARHAVVADRSLTFDGQMLVCSTRVVVKEAYLEAESALALVLPQHFWDALISW